MTIKRATKHRAKPAGRVVTGVSAYRWVAASPKKAAAKKKRK